MPSTSKTTQVVASRVPNVIAAQVSYLAKLEQITISEVVHRLLAERLSERKTKAA